VIPDFERPSTDSRALVIRVDEQVHEVVALHLNVADDLTATRGDLRTHRVFRRESTAEELQPHRRVESLGDSRFER